MMIKAYGLFWSVDQVNWAPGKGKKNAFRLLGRIGANQGTLRMSDFREQRGIYILYGNHGPYYTGLTREQDLGKRLNDHLWDEHAGSWNRFSWFGFRSVLKSKDEYGLLRLRRVASVALGDPKDIIGDIEALLIRAMGLANRAQMNFKNAEEWQQVKLGEVEKYMARIAPT